jgi:hypothetical protein
MFPAVSYGSSSKDGSPSKIATSIAVPLGSEKVPLRRHPFSLFFESHSSRATVAKFTTHTIIEIFEHEKYREL